MYEIYVDRYISKRKGKKKEKDDKDERKNELEFQAVSTDSHPLSKETNSEWNEFFEDQKLWSKIEKDSVRTKTSVQKFSEQIIKHYPIISKF